MATHSSSLESIRPWLAEASDAVEVAWTRGGHIGFPDPFLGGRDTVLPRSAVPLEPQLIRGLERHG